MHKYDPCVLLHAASSWHLWGFVSHSSISVVKLEIKKKLIRYQLKTLAFRFLTESHRSSQKPQFHCSFLFLSGSLVGHFNYAIISEFSLQLLYWVINIRMNCSYVNQITSAILSISNISRLTIAYMWSNGVGAVCILMTRVVSLTLINVYEITDEKKMGFLNYAKLLCMRHYLVKKCKSWLFSILCWIVRTRDCRTWWKQVIYVKAIYGYLYNYAHLR